MPSGFFCLLRFYLRVDNTLIRVIDTRFHYEEGNNYILREYTERESKTEDLKVSFVNVVDFFGGFSRDYFSIFQLPIPVLRDQNEVVNHLDLKLEVTEKLSFDREVAAQK